MPGETVPFSRPTPTRKSFSRRRKPSRVMMLMVPAMARAPVSAVGARRISIRSICSGVSDSTEKPGGVRWPSMRICV
jgi:hypothetical protein